MSKKFKPNLSPPPKKRRVRFADDVAYMVEVNGVRKWSNELTDADRKEIADEDARKLFTVMILTKALEIWIPYWFGGRFKGFSKTVFNNLMHSLKAVNSNKERLLKNGDKGEEGIETWEMWSEDLAIILEAALKPNGKKRLLGLSKQITKS